jgi:hypothetical protein
MARYLLCAFRIDAWQIPSRSKSLAEVRRNGWLSGFLICGEDCAMIAKGFKCGDYEPRNDWFIFFEFLKAAKDLKF